MASSQESGPTQIQLQLQGDISNNLKEDLTYHDRHHWDDVKTHFIICPEEVKGGAREDFHETGPPYYKAALVYKFTINGVTQRWMFAWKSPPPAAHPTNKVLTKLYKGEPIIWPQIGAELELPSTTNISSYTQDGVTVLFAAPEEGTSDFKAGISYAK